MNLESTSKSFNLPGIKKGMYMCWNIVTQCCNDVRVVLKDECKTYVDETKPVTSSGNLNKLSIGDAFVQGNNLTIEFSSTKSNSFDRSVSNYMPISWHGIIKDNNTRIAIRGTILI